MRKPTYSAVTSTLALLVALGGGAYAAAIAENSVGTKQLKDNAVTSAKIDSAAVGKTDIKANAITGEKIAAGSVGPGDIAEGAVASNQILNGTVSEDDLASGAKQIFGYERVYSGNQTLPPVETNSGFASATVDCPPGKVALGGGYWMEWSDTQIVWSYAIDDDTWQVQARNPSSATGKEFGAHVICANG